MKVMTMDEMAQKVARKAIDQYGVWAAASFLLVAYRKDESFKKGLLASVSSGIKDSGLCDELTSDEIQELSLAITDRVFGA